MMFANNLVEVMRTPSLFIIYYVTFNFSIKIFYFNFINLYMDFKYLLFFKKYFVYNFIDKSMRI